MYRRIRDLREDADMTQKQIAKILHCSQQVYSDYELGTRNLPVDILIRLAQYHKTTTDYLLGLTDRRERL
ncbi:MAG: helix-turn-helix domain-containing protein [Oscillospiraceae bacterium]|nr:helix-turn-helix domain-containing protein [Oscillospiraceae bacterium]